MLTVEVIDNTNFTADQAKLQLENYDHIAFAEAVYYAHKDQYGIKGHHLLKASKEQLVSWWLNHYTWNEKGQYWDSIIPFN